MRERGARARSRTRQPYEWHLTVSRGWQGRTGATFALKLCWSDNQYASNDRHAYALSSFSKSP
jgi:hypothetical protein